MNAPYTVNSSRGRVSGTIRSQCFTMKNGAYIKTTSHFFKQDIPTLIDILNDVNKQIEDNQERRRA